MPSYEWTGDGTFRDRRNGREVEPGDVVELDEHVGGPQPDMVEVVAETEDEGDEAAEKGEAVDSESGDVEPPINPDEYTVDGLEETLDQISISEAEREALLERERETGDRTTAIEAIEEA